ncbi:iron-sulfur cluster co-chaperone protein HscB homolog [Andrographis paniculata]|uniref:iron-sulfur cluster co-chaperone protein HscB homolog n=1 Tax=Andrographis paniculata TaxID=175694 RepID=UPI0021E8512F|nr:iron-sulfur cluster co-chaperone protein HscB homolog [Andrographis paniculata]
MWKTKLCNSTQFSLIARRAGNSTDFCSSIVNSRCYNCSIFNSSQIVSRSSSFSPFSSASCFLGGQPGKPFPSARVLLLANPSGVSASENGLSLRNGNFFCSQPKSAETFHCWNCGAGADSVMASLFCASCRSVQPVNEAIDYFQIFGLERKYEIDLEELEKKYKDWQKKLHPDLVHSKSQQERDYAAEQSARVIDAYRTLADPLSRAIYSVKLAGVHIDEEERVTDPELLAEIMELREAVEEAEDTQALNKIQSQLREKLQNWSKSYEEAYKSKNYEDAMTAIRRMTYYKRASEEIVKKL